MPGAWTWLTFGEYGSANSYSYTRVRRASRWLPRSVGHAHESSVISEAKAAPADGYAVSGYRVATLPALAPNAVLSNVG
jgi:hypothetical protein